MHTLRSNGNYGQSTSLMTLTGSTNTRCPTSSSSSSNSTDNSNNGNGDKGNNGGNNNNDNNNGQNNNQDGGSNNDKSSSKTGVIAGVVIAAFFSIFFGLLAWFFVRRRNQAKGGVRERKDWTIDRNDSIKFMGGRARLPSNPSENEITPFALPQGQHTIPPMSAHGYADLQASPFMPEARRPHTEINESSRGSYYRDQAESDVDEHDAYAMDAFRTSGIGSSSASQSRSNGQESQSSRGFMLVNDEGGQREGYYGSQTKASLQNAQAQPQRQIFQHEDAGVAGLEEIPPAYPGPSNGLSGR